MQPIAWGEPCVQRRPSSLGSLGTPKVSTAQRKAGPPQGAVATLCRLYAKLLRRPAARICSVCGRPTSTFVLTVTATERTFTHRGRPARQRPEWKAPPTFTRPRRHLALAPDRASAAPALQHPLATHTRPSEFSKAARCSGRFFRVAIYEPAVRGLRRPAISEHSTRSGAQCRTADSRLRESLAGGERFARRIHRVPRQM